LVTDVLDLSIEKAAEFMSETQQAGSYSGKIALVTGSGRGIGRAIAHFFAQNGADVVVNYFRNRAPAEATASTVESLGQRALVVKANVGEFEALERLFSTVEDQWGGLDIFVHNAASGFNRPVMEQRPKGWEWTLNINAKAALFGAQRAAPLMKARGGGYIVNISSPGSQRVLPEYVVVGASKAALEAITRYLAIELAPDNIRVNAVSPGIVDTEALQHFSTIKNDPDLLQRAAARIPAGRLISVEDVAQVVGFLCSPGAAMICGQTILVDGGASLPFKQY
jgi:enoyl-[acyl-carrier protein] reductase III